MIPELFFNDLCRRKTCGVMATVLHSDGHGPARAGDRLFFSAGRLVTGTVGGGSNEQQVLQACAALTTGRRQLDISSFLPGTLPSCGGRLRVLLEWLDLGNPPASSFRETLQQLVPGPDPLLLLSLLDESDAPPCYLLANENGILAALNGEGRTVAVAAELWPQLMTTEQCGLQELTINAGRCSVFLQPLNRNGRLFLLGGGHVAKEVAWLADRTGFQVIVVDPRRELMGPESFPATCTLCPEHYDHFISRSSLGSRDFLVIAGPDHATDLALLEQAANTSARYIGVMGSRGKIASFEKVLREKGLWQILTGRLHAPIGLPIASRRPAEVAVSIVAELIQVRAQSTQTADAVSTSPGSGPVNKIIEE